MADEMNVGGQIRENALASVGTVAGDHDLIVGEPLGHQDDEFQGQFGPSSMIRIVLGFGGFLLAFFPLRILFPLGQPLAVPVQANGDGQGEDLGTVPRTGKATIRVSTTQSCPQLTRDFP